MKIIRITTKRKSPTKRKGSPHDRNVLEFSRAAKSSSAISRSFYSLLHNSPDCRRISRLTQVIRQAMQHDYVNHWGERTMKDGALELLQGYEFNERNQVSYALRKQVTATINPVTGLCLVELPRLLPADDLHYGGNYTHVLLTAAAGCFGHEPEPFPVSIARTAYLQRDQSTAIELVTMVDVQDGCPIFLLLGIEFFQLINGKYYYLSRGGTLTLQIVAVERGTISDC